MFRILTVCLGNVCRSPLAERLLASRLEASGESDFTVTSAGVIGMVGRGMEPEAAQQLVRLGGVPDGFVARRLESGQVREAELVLTATLDVRRQVLEEAPGGLRRTFTLREFAALCDATDVEMLGRPLDIVADAGSRRQSVAHLDLDVPDPMGRSSETHARVAELIEEAVQAITNALVPAGRAVE